MAYGNVTGDHKMPLVVIGKLKKKKHSFKKISEPTSLPLSYKGKKIESNLWERIDWSGSPSMVTSQDLVVFLKLLQTLSPF